MNYPAKAKNSFRTKLNLFIYEAVVNDMEEFSLEDFKNYEITRKVVDEYTEVYWQELVSFKIRDKTIGEIEKRISKIMNERDYQLREFEVYYIKEVFPEIFPAKDFEVLTKMDKCYYCGITEKEIIELANNRKLRKKNLRGWHLEIDRFDSNLEYKPDNCALCCYWCNNAKTDEFSEEEFHDIGKVISSIWHKRLGNQNH